MNKSVLLVDDKPEIAKIIILYLSGYNVKYVENPIIALNWLRAGNIPDAIISDLMMPEMSGEEFVTVLKEDEVFSRIPILILTSVESDSDRKRLFEKGANDFILKPFNPEELKTRIKVLLK
ncbi:response regulator transcription factor [uncultured Parabacteroides sp.]|uniref:response regulator n=1 Tax=uncultured Parabacteroides sp. TaxID=512312 RepID=UPI0025EBFC43|nr:response regulator transcription factor [uncultured Parabacteroides sp.]MCD7850070.1 response regulator transcription factor [Parabacteroides sp.]